MVAIPIFTVFISFFETTGNYFDLLKDTFLVKYITNSFLILFGVLFLTLVFGSYIGEDALGGAKNDYLFHEKYIVAFYQNKSKLKTSSLLLLLLRM